MLNKNVILVASFSFSLLLAISDFFSFKINPKIFFIFHNLFALLIGLLLAYISKSLFIKKSGLNYINFLIMVSGLGMAVIHAAKIIIGKCL